MFERFGRVTRVFLAKDRETGRAKGFAFISFQERTDAARACEKMDGCTWIFFWFFPSPFFINLPCSQILTRKQTDLGT